MTEDNEVLEYIIIDSGRSRAGEAPAWLKTTTVSLAVLFVGLFAYHSHEASQSQIATNFNNAGQYTWPIASPFQEIAPADSTLEPSSP